MEHDFHAEIKRRVYEFMIREGWTVFPECQLPNKKVADLLAIDRRARVLLIEVKTTLLGYLVETAKSKYRVWTDALYVAAPQIEVESLLEPQPTPAFPQDWSDVGMLAISGHRISLRRQAQHRPMCEDNRRRLTIHLQKLRPNW